VINCPKIKGRLPSRGRRKNRGIRKGSKSAHTHQGNFAYVTRQKEKEGGGRLTALQIVKVFLNILVPEEF